MLGLIKKALWVTVMALSLGSTAYAQDTIKMGALATLEGAYAVLGEDGMRGVKMALKEFNNMAGGKKIELITASSDASPDSAITRKPPCAPHPRRRATSRPTASSPRCG